MVVGWVPTYQVKLQLMLRLSWAVTIFTANCYWHTDTNTAMAKNIPGNLLEKSIPAFSPWIKYNLPTSYRHSVACPVEKIETTSEKFTQRDIRRRKLHNITALLPPKHTLNKNTSVTEKFEFLKGSATDPIGLGQAGTRIHGTSVQKICTAV